MLSHVLSEDGYRHTGLLLLGLLLLGCWDVRPICSIIAMSTVLDARTAAPRLLPRGTPAPGGDAAAAAAPLAIVLVLKILLVYVLPGRIMGCIWK